MMDSDRSGTCDEILRKVAELPFYKNILRKHGVKEPMTDQDARIHGDNAVFDTQRSLRILIIARTGFWDCGITTYGLEPPRNIAYLDQWQNSWKADVREEEWNNIPDHPETARGERDAKVISRSMRLKYVLRSGAENRGFASCSPTATPLDNPSCGWWKLPSELKMQVLEHNVVFPSDVVVLARYWNESTELREHNRVRHEGTALKFDIGLKVPKFMIPTHENGGSAYELPIDVFEILGGVTSVLEPRLVSKEFYEIVTKAFYARNLFEVFDDVTSTGSSVPAAYPSYNAHFPMTDRFLGYLARSTAADGHLRYHKNSSPPLSIVKCLRLRKEIRYLPHHLRQWQTTMNLVVYHCTLKKLVIDGMDCRVKDPSAIQAMPELVHYITNRQKSKERLDFFVRGNRELEDWIKTQAQAQISHDPKHQPTEPKLPTQTFLSSYALLERLPLEQIDTPVSKREQDRIQRSEVELFESQKRDSDSATKGLQASLARATSISEKAEILSTLATRVNLAYATRSSDLHRSYSQGVLEGEWGTDQLIDDIEAHKRLESILTVLERSIARARGDGGWK